MTPCSSGFSKFPGCGFSKLPLGNASRPTVLYTKQQFDDDGPDLVPVNRPKAVESHTREASYTTETLQKQLDLIKRFASTAVEGDQKKFSRLQAAESTYIEAIRQLCELLVWGEKYDESFFGLFCEKRTLVDLSNLLGCRKVSRGVKLQVLQTMSILVQSLRRTTSLYSLLSGNHINEIIGAPLEFKNEEVVTQYISLLKSLSLRLNMETVRFFFPPTQAIIPTLD